MSAYNRSLYTESTSGLDRLGISATCRDCFGLLSPNPYGGPTNGGEPARQPYQSGSVRRYCDLLDAGVEGNPEMLLDIIKDLRCVFDKTFGNTKTLEGRNRNLQGTIESLKQEIIDSEECQDALKKELCRIQAEFAVAQKSYNDEVDRRVVLESIVEQLRIKLTRMEAEAEVNAKERVELTECIRELETKLARACEVIESLKTDNAKLETGVRELSDWKVRNHESLNMNKGRIGNYEEALAKCCKRNEELEKEVECSKNEADCLNQLVQKLQCENKNICDEHERERQAWFQECDALRKAITELKEGHDAQVLKNKEMCEALNRSLEEHHKEIDCLKRECLKSKELYEREKSERERLQRLQAQDRQGSSITPEVAAYPANPRNSYEQQERLQPQSQRASSIPPRTASYKVSPLNFHPCC